MLNSQSTGTAGNTNNTQHQVKFEPTVKLAVYTVDYPVYTTESRDRQRRSIRYGEFNIAFIPHHDRITTKNCENSNTLIMNTSTGTDFDSTLIPYSYVFVSIHFRTCKIPSSENSQMERNENTASRRSFGDGRKGYNIPINDSIWQFQHFPIWIHPNKVRRCLLCEKVADLENEKGRKSHQKEG